MSRDTVVAGSIQAEATEKFEMTLSLNVLRHLGINLYSSNPAVLSEAVANAWDADANRVDITLNIAEGKIVVQDTGCGMTLEEVNRRFLKIGYQRREEEGGAETPSGRPVMGRKGIGKLALFSIARTILVETVKGGSKSAFEMDLGEIEKVIKGDESGETDPETARTYHPVEKPTDDITFEKGTRITLTNLSRGIDQTATHLKKRLARRFSIMGNEHNFHVFIDNLEVTAADRDYAPTVQYIWAYGEDAAQDNTLARAIKAEHRFKRPSEVGNGMKVYGWIGTAFDTTSLKDPVSGESSNRVPLMIRGKMAQEDLLGGVSEVGVYQNYLVGEIHADYLDDNDEEDIATSSRQSIREDDERYLALVAFISKEMKHIKGNWTDLRNDGGTKKALDIPEIKAWYLTLGADTRKKVERLFGKVYQLGLEAEDQNELFAQSVLAFEIMKQRDSLDALEAMDATDLKTVSKILTDSSQLEAVLYHKIVKSRLGVIDRLETLLQEKALEKLLQDHLYENLWLLDPGWEPASLPSMESSMKKEFAEIAKDLPKAEADSRLDIRYQKTSGLHVIVELKKGDRLTNTDELTAQVRKYRKALHKWLREIGRADEPIAIVCVVGKELRDWTTEEDGRRTSAEILAALNTRVIMYQELLQNARNAYEEYLRKSGEVGRIQKILDALTRQVDTAS